MKDCRIDCMKKEMNIEEFLKVQIEEYTLRLN